VALGLFIGSQPIFGCHTPLVLVLCLWLRLDAAIAWVASNISNPFFAPALLTAEVQVGAYLRTGHVLRLDRELSGWSAVVDFAGYAFLGAPVVGLSLAVAGGAATYASIALKRRILPASGRPEPYRLPDNAPPWVAAVERVASRYAPPEESTPAERAHFHYVRVKLLGDPIARLIADIAGDTPGALGDVLDIGTGRGQLPILLLELGRAASARGIDWDRAKIEEARRAARAAGAGGDNPAAPALQFTDGDARSLALHPADTVLLIDLLHYFTLEEQDALVRRAALALRPGGRLLIREADTEQGLRSFITLLEERIFTGLRWNRGERVRFRPAREIVAILASLGLSCRVEPAWGKTPFSNVLIVARRPAAAGSAGPPTGL
jgi:SAM-dependent methyltransferase